MLQRTDYLEKTGEHPLRVEQMRSSTTGSSDWPWAERLVTSWSPMRRPPIGLWCLSFPASPGEFNFHFHLALQELGGDWPLVC